MGTTSKMSDPLADHFPRLSTNKHRLEFPQELRLSQEDLSQKDRGTKGYPMPHFFASMRHEFLESHGPVLACFCSVHSSLGF